MRARRLPSRGPSARPSGARGRGAAAFALAVAFGGVVGAPAEARADAPSADRVRAAAEEYDRGRRAYLAGEFEQASLHFENAYRDAPRAEAIRNAIRARQKATERATGAAGLTGRAKLATLAALALREHEGDAPTVELARPALEEASKKVYEVQLRCVPGCAVVVDGKLASFKDGELHRVFVEPGPHAVQATFTDGPTVERKVTGEAGGGEAIELRQPKTPAAVEPALTTTRPVRGPGGAAATGGQGADKPFGKAVFFGLAGATVVAGGLAVASGLDTLGNPGTDRVRRECAGLGEACPLYEDARASQLRTNVAIGVASGLGVVTAVVGVFFTQWRAAEAPATTGARWLAPRLAVGREGAYVGGGVSF